MATFKNTLGDLINAEQEVFQETLGYGYDAVGNRTYESITKTSTQSKNYTYYANSNRLLTDGHYAFVYDDDGNLTRKGSKFTLAGETVSFTTNGKGVEYWEYSYNLRNQLSQVRKNGQLVAAYAYDGLGLRVSATTTTTSKTTGDSKTTTRDYLFDLGDRVIHDKVISTTGQLPAAEDPETSTENSYVFVGGAHFAKVEGAIGSSTEIYYYHNDHLGSPMAITDKDGNVAWSQDYLPYGEALNENATTTKTRFTFTGKELDPATGLMYYNARWYDPDLGRFMTEDTHAGDPNEPQTLNRFSYVSGNPLKYVDPDGRKIRLATTDRYLVAAYREAIEYLRGSDDFEKVHDILEKSSNTITIEIDRFLADGDAYSPRNDTVKWDPDSGLRVGSGDVQTPAMGLAHEMVHAAQDQAGLIPSNLTVEQRLAIENAVVTQYETPIAMDLGEPVRNDYDDVDWSDPTPTTTDPISNDEDNWPGRW